jgi:outer membrane protein TolC
LSGLSALGDWALIIADNRLQSVIAKALTQSPELIAAYNDLQIAREQLTITGASDYPALTLSLDNSRRKSVSSDGSKIANSAGIDLNLSYEVDIWGKLSAEQQQSC